MNSSQISESLSNIIHFNNAIQSNKLKLINKLVLLSEKEKVHLSSKEYFHVIFSLINELYLYLRSPIHSNYFLEALANKLFDKNLHLNPSINLVTVLASSTANEEFPYFMRFVDIFNHYQIKTNNYVLFVHWEDELEITDNQDYTKFYSKLAPIQEIAKHKESAIYVIPLHLSHTDYSHPYLSTLNQAFHNNIRLYQSSMLKEKIKDPTLIKDMQWIKDFYQRQDSLKHFSSEKAFFDLAMRRSIGKLGTELSLLQQESNSTLFLMLTSELNKRFLNCYDSLIPILNIKVKDN
jgi:hypothetical protein